MTTKQQVLMALALSALGICLRLLPHLPNFTPIAAIGIIAGLYLSNRYVFWVPIVAMIISDLAIGFYNFGIMLSVYGSFVLIAFLGVLARKYKNLPVIFGASISSSVLFFVITNFAVWQLGTMYAKTFAGLMESYTMALPFFRATLAGDLFYTLTLFTVFEFSLVYMHRRSESISTQIV